MVVETGFGPRRRLDSINRIYVGYQYTSGICMSVDCICSAKERTTLSVDLSVESTVCFYIVNVCKKF